MLGAVSGALTTGSTRPPPTLAFGGDAGTAAGTPTYSGVNSAVTKGVLNPSGLPGSWLLAMMEPTMMGKGLHGRQKCIQQGRPLFMAPAPANIKCEENPIPVTVDSQRKGFASGIYSRCQRDGTARSLVVTALPLKIEPCDSWRDISNSKLRKSCCQNSWAIPLCGTHDA